MTPSNVHVGTGALEPSATLSMRDENAKRRRAAVTSRTPQDGNKNTHGHDA